MWIMNLSSEKTHPRAPTMHMAVTNTIVRTVSGDLGTSRMPSGHSCGSRMAGKILYENELYL